MTINFLKPPAIPDNVPDGLQKEIEVLERLASKEEVLEHAYDFLSQKYRGYRLKTIIYIWELFDTDINHLWEKQGFLHCTNLNYLLEILLVKSGKFHSSDIKFSWTALHYVSPHQYMKVRVGSSQWMKVDLWGKVYGIKLGDFGHGFHTGHLRAISEKSLQ